MRNKYYEEDKQVSKELQAEIDALRPKRPKQEKKLTLRDVTVNILDDYCDGIDREVEVYDYDIVDDILKVFLKQIHNEIKGKRNEGVIDLNWVDIIFRRYTE